MTTQYNFETTVDKLQLGDHVRAIADAAWGTAIVEKVDEHYVYLFRPYGRNDGFAYGGDGTPGHGQVICLIGAEHYVLPRDARQRIFVYRREALR